MLIFLGRLPYKLIINNQNYFLLLVLKEGNYHLFQGKPVAKKI